MTKQESMQLTPGIYRIHWTEGGSSLAAIGMGMDGSRWLAPTNWVIPTEYVKWETVQSAESLAIPAPPVRSVDDAATWRNVCETQRELIEQLFDILHGRA